MHLYSIDYLPQKRNTILIFKYFAKHFTCKQKVLLIEYNCCELITAIEFEFQPGEVLTMAKCNVCGKSVHFGANVSHSHRRSNRIWKPNIKSVRVKTEGGAKKMYVCTSCLKSGRVERA